MSVNYLYSQKKTLDPIFLNKISKNIIIYRIANYNFYNEDNCKNNIKYNSENLLPNEDEYLELLTLKEVKYRYPLEGYSLYSVYNINDYVFKKVNDSTEKYSSYSHGNTFDMLLSKRFLVGIDEKSKEIRYLSGSFFKDCIAHDFNLNIKNSKSFYIFLNIKLFNYDISGILFLKKRKKHLIFRAYAKNLKSDILIKIDRKNYDSIQVKEIKSDWTEKGSYEWKK